MASENVVAQAKRSKDATTKTSHTREKYAAIKIEKVNSPEPKQMISVVKRSSWQQQLKSYPSFWERILSSDKIKLMETKSQHDLWLNSVWKERMKL